MTTLIQSDFKGERLLLAELTHRINNEFAAASGLVSLAAARISAPDVKEVLADVKNRLANFARVQQALQVPALRISVDATDYLQKLCVAISESKLSERGITLRLTAPPLQLNSEQCWRLGLIVSELISNCARHAFAAKGGHIQVEISARGPFVSCVVADDGSSPEEIVPGNGLRIVEALARELPGHIEQRFGSDGSVSGIVFTAINLS